MSSRYLSSPLFTGTISAHLHLRMQIACFPTPKSFYSLLFFSLVSLSRLGSPFSFFLSFFFFSVLPSVESAEEKLGKSDKTAYDIELENLMARTDRIKQFVPTRATKMERN